ncbi:uncharacterized protein E0L32_004162 [Thyridium curvatum]|uniref:Chitin-binding type-4 domain-containing protein n=1 Tax=Thyridium curvatum TaxID=1093900 RepID=A0A507B8K6_9PEZI|nr:uncharacterized protein E0L32_004162 [Thyridium curvatum]TPX16167.1 hypothetical protein E0L32_004162 [Thyridium curvatum]
MLFPSILALVTVASAHGVVQKPHPRTPGAETSTACGKVLTDFYKADNTSYPEALVRSHPTFKPATSSCNPYLCRGYQFADNTANVYSYKAGEKVDFSVYIRIPHVGNANVSVVDAKANKVIGEPLKSWPSGYADGKQFPNLPKDQTQFSVTIPDLSGKCASPGDCVIQWYWFGQGQTYEDCVDFTFGSAPATSMRRGSRIAA